MLKNVIIKDIASYETVSIQHDENALELWIILTMPISVSCQDLPIGLLSYDTQVLPYKPPKSKKGYN